MIVSRALLLLALSQQLHEEEPKLTLPVREQLWRQMDSYANGLTAKPESLRRLLKTRMGYPPPAMSVQSKLRLEKSGEDAVATYYRSYLTVAPGMDAYGLYIVPKKRVARRAPLVISQHGGGGTPEMATYNGGTNYHDQVRGAVAQGYVVYAPHTVMYPFRDRDLGTAIPSAVRKDLDEKFRAAGTSLAAVEVYKIQLAIDELVKRPEIDPNRIAMIGLSYGGYYSLYTAAVEPRIKVVVASCSVRNEEPVLDSKIEGRLLDLAPADVAGLIAPRALQIQTGIDDKSSPIDQARIAAAKARSFYEKAGALPKFSFEEFAGGHEFRGSLVWPFLKKWL
ncbi:alpha/beta hydrolase family protein [Bryobacter aggregatus]|uniref:alpha/beta hydrolase family protein n=1 Tax=Bryobacter aggregatus TaxID=360054 RepID=UPI00068A5605|nr:prolyl oligopeptidase family serine peptidase [Bryobacter aggregatus]